jgi:hypothetical protein
MKIAVGKYFKYFIVREGMPPKKTLQGVVWGVGLRAIKLDPFTPEGRQRQSWYRVCE